ncbi:MAG TPA: protoporphyrinogen oxidase [Methylomirabilota bacterium]|nr:protoporphyrinogen oxidase [Methylomirabilota bacterium]
MSSVGVVGAGITGLVAALELQERGVEVAVYEASPRPGGVIRSPHHQGFIVESGPNTLLETAPYFSELIRKVGLDGRRLYSAPEASNRYIVRGGQLVPVPASPPGFLKSKLFSSGAKLRLFREPFVRRAPAALEETVAQFVRRRLGQEFLDYAINPMIAGIYAGDPERLSVSEGFPKLHSLEQQHGSLLIGQFARAKELRAKGEVSKQDAPKVTFTDGLQELPDAIAAKLGPALRLNTPVAGARRNGNEWDLQLASGEIVRHDALLFALPAHKLASMEVSSGNRVSLAALSEIVYAPVTTLALGFRREDVAHPLDGFGVLVPEKENRSILGCIFSSSLFPNRAPAGHVLLTCYIGGMRQPALVELDQEEQVQLAIADLGKLLGVRNAPVFASRTVYQKAIPQYELGYGRFKKFFSEIENECPGVFLGGNYRDGIALGDSILNGRALAGRIQDHLTAAASAPSFNFPNARPAAHIERT